MNPLLEDIYSNKLLAKNLVELVEKKKGQAFTWPFTMEVNTYCEVNEAGHLFTTTRFNNSL